MKVVLITGCSSGIGLETALAFARTGDTVYASMRDTTKSTALKEKAARENLPLKIIELDVTRPGSFQAVIDHILEDSGRIDVLVNNAGVLPIGAFEDASEDDLRHTMEVNFFGPALLSQAVLPAMRRQREGYIIMLSSLSGMASKSGDAAYAASKFALEGLTEGFRNEVARWNIKTALIEPGQYATNIFRDVSSIKSKDASPYSPLNQALHDEIANAAGGGLPPERLAQLVVDVSRSDGARFRWPADDTAERVMNAMFAQSDADRSSFLRSVAGIDWWVNGEDAPNKK